MNVQHRCRALQAIAAGLVLLLAGCANGTAAAAPPAASSAAASTTIAADAAAAAKAATGSAAVSSTASSSRSAVQASAKPIPGGDTQPGCAARAMARGTFNPVCSEYQGYLDPGTTSGRAPTSGEIQRENLCRNGEIPRTDC